MHSSSQQAHDGVGPNSPEQKVHLPESTPHNNVERDSDEIVDRLRAGSVPALEEVMTAYRSRIYTLAFGFTKNHHDAEDIVQETFLRAFHAAPRFRGDASLNTWLYAIATNVARNRYWYWRRRKRDRTVSLDEPGHPEIRAALHDAIVREDESVAAESELNDLVIHIENGIARLSERDRRILLLRNGQHVPYMEIARALGIAIGTVKSRLARARMRLRLRVNLETSASRALLRKAS